MLLKLLGVVDIGVALMLILTIFGIPVGRLYVFFTIVHAAKAAFFIRNFFSIVDMMIVLYTIIAPFWNNTLLTILIAGFLFYKGVYSLV